MGENGERVPFLLFLGQKRHLWYSPSPPIHNTTIQLDDNTLVPSRSTQIHGKTVILERLFYNVVWRERKVCGCCCNCPIGRAISLSVRLSNYCYEAFKTDLKSTSKNYSSTNYISLLLRSSHKFKSITSDV